MERASAGFRVFAICMFLGASLLSVLFLRSVPVFSLSVGISLFLTLFFGVVVGLLFALKVTCRVNERAKCIAFQIQFLKWERSKLSVGFDEVERVETGITESGNDDRFQVAFRLKTGKVKVLPVADEQAGQRLADQIASIMGISVVHHPKDRFVSFSESSRRSG